MLSVNVRLLSRMMIAPAAITIPPQSARLCVKLFPDRVILVLFTTRAVPSLSWKEQLLTSAYCVDCTNRAIRLLATGTPGKVIPKAYFILQDVKAKEFLKSTILVKLRPTNPLQTTVALLPEVGFPHAHG